MSNPGVLYLTNKKLSSGVSFRMEDNIGESIHLHYGDEWRIDLTVNEFMMLQEKADEWLESLLGHTGFKSEYFDPIFLDMISECLVDLEKVTFDEVRLADLKVSTRNCLNLPIVRNIGKSRIVKALNGSARELDNYAQENFRGQTNLDRVMQMAEKIGADGYPFDDKYIVLFNDRNNVRDGQHRAGCLYNIHGGNYVVKVIRMHFKDGKYNSSNHPWIKSLFAWSPARIKKTLRKILSFVKRCIKGVLRRVKRILGL